MRHYEVTFIVDPVLSDDERKAIVQFYADYLRKENCEIVHIDEMGLHPLAYPIAKRQSGYYACIEWTCEDASFLVKYELAMRRDERLLRFLSVKLDKYGVKYNEDKRAGKIGKKKKEKTTKPRTSEAPVAAATPAPAAAVEPAPVVAAAPAPAAAVEPVVEPEEVVPPTPIAEETSAPKAEVSTAETQEQEEPAITPVSEEAPEA